MAFPIQREAVLAEMIHVEKCTPSFTSDFQNISEQKKKMSPNPYQGLKFHEYNLR